MREKNVNMRERRKIEISYGLISKIGKIIPLKIKLFFAWTRLFFPWIDRKKLYGFVASVKTRGNVSRFF